MANSKFLFHGNLCHDRVRIARALHKPPLTQEDLAREMNLMGVGITPLIISRIENNTRHVIDAELMAFSKVFGVSIDWLCGSGDDLEFEEG